MHKIFGNHSMDKRKKLAFLCNNMRSLNGVERVLSQRLSLLAEDANYEVFLITCNQYGVPFSFPISPKVHHIDLATRFLLRCSYRGIYQYIDRFFSKRRYIKAIRQCLEYLSPDVITCVDMHVADLKAVLSINTNAVKVVECHSGRSAYFADLKKIKLFYKYYIGLRLKTKMLHLVTKFDKVVVMSEAEKAEWALNEKVVYIPNMLPTYPLDAKKASETYHRVISVGRYAYQKGYDMLLESWCIVEKQHPEWTLHIYGSHDGDAGDYENLQSIIDRLRLKNAVLHHATADVYACYKKSDFYVMSSRFESLGLVFIEAMSCGLPVVSFDCKYGPKSIVKDGQTGILVPQGDTESLAISMCKMIDETEERERMSINARDEAAHYISDRIMPLWDAFYQSL